MGKIGKYETIFDHFATNVENFDFRNNEAVFFQTHTWFFSPSLDGSNDV